MLSPDPKRTRPLVAYKGRRFFSLSTIGLLLLTACGQAIAPARPPEVPASADWVGGKDGGAWIECSAGISDDANMCTVYQAYSGEVWVSGLFVLEASGRPASAGELDFAFFNGVAIGLKGGEILVPVASWREEKERDSQHSDPAATSSP